MSKYGFNAGIARNHTESEHPNLWRDLYSLFSPRCGTQGAKLINYGLNGGAGSLSATGATWVPSDRGGAVSLNGTTGTVNWTQHKTVSTPDATFIAWAKPLATLPIYAGIMVSRASSLLGLMVSDHASRPLTCLWDGGSVEYSANTGLSFTTGLWHMCAATIHGATITIYLCSAAGIRTYAPSLSSLTRALAGAWWLGLDPNPGSAGQRNWPGLIGDSYIYTRALGKSEIMQVFSGASPLTPRRQPVVYFNSGAAPETNTTNFFRFFR